MLYLSALDKENLKYVFCDGSIETDTIPSKALDPLEFL